jgi:PucR C-terminal helix-turn-helix domain/GGDEF-like domain
MRELAARLRERREEIEGAVLARVEAVSDPTEVEDPEYGQGLREAVGGALEYGIAGIEAGEEHRPAPPPQLLAQARRAARHGVSLDRVLRRYFAGYSLLSDFVVREADAAGLAAAELQRLLWSVSSLLDDLVAVVAQEHARELQDLEPPGDPGQRFAERVRRLLAGEPLSTGDLRYELDCWHLGAIASGPGAEEAMRDLSAALDRLCLLVRAHGDTIWIWLGGRSRLSAQVALGLAERSLPGEVSLALGEPGQGIEGWRFTHRQAKAAMHVAQRGPRRRVHYADVALLASALRDEVLCASLESIYLAPFAGERDGGSALRDTLRAYFAVGRNISSAAARLGVARQTVSIRLRAAEERIGRPLDACGTEAEIALQLQGLSEPPVQTSS